MQSSVFVVATDDSSFTQSDSVKPKGKKRSSDAASSRVTVKKTKPVMLECNICIMWDVILTKSIDTL